MGGLSECRSGNWWEGRPKRSEEEEECSVEGREGWRGGRLSIRFEVCAEDSDDEKGSYIQTYFTLTVDRKLELLLPVREVRPSKQRLGSSSEEQLSWGRSSRTIRKEQSARLSR